GYRPVSNVVDATNYVLLVTGQPLHAFDLDKVGGSKILVRRAGSGEKITTLDGEVRELDTDDLVIADSNVPVAIAGVMGGIETEVSAGTKRVMLESAHFDPRSIARSAKRHGLRSEASARFERGSDPRNVEYPAALAASLMVDWAGGRVAAGNVVVGSAPELGQPIELRPERCRAILGFDISGDEMVDALTRLGLSPTLSDGVIRVARLSRRGDLQLEEDLIEEVARLGGYDRVPSTLASGRYRAGSLTRAQILIRRIRSALAGAGLFEAYTPTFIGPDDLAVLGIEDDHAWGGPLRVTNPLSRDESLLRTSLIPGLLQCVKTNISRRNLDIRLFEIGRVFHGSDGQLPNEPERLSVVIAGTQRQEWLSEERELDLFDLKGALEVLFSSLRTPDVRFVDSAGHPAHPTRSCLVTTGGRTLGVLGELDPTIAEAADLGIRVFFAEIELEALIETAADPQPTQQVWRFPAVLLDLAMVIEESIPIDAILGVVHSVGGDHLESARIFDVYRGAQVESGYRSVAISLVFRNEERTMTESEAIEVRDRIAAELSSRFGAQVRGS
ncbi:MAG TPA: phenylalanine--tRNA ligase subunit beta, partial [Actinomycetota bacterium]|nr:phenylalanine--tRNA ligase subunit beta [Actinomycetota bacterium]